MEIGVALGVGGAAIATIAMAGSAIEMLIIGQAVTGMIMGDPKKFGQSLVLMAFGTTNGIYGMLMAFLILMKALTVTDIGTGLYLLASGIPIGVVGYAAAVAQGRVAAEGAVLVAKRSGEMGKVIIYAAMIETFAVFALLISFLMYNNV